MILPLMALLIVPQSLATSSTAEIDIDIDVTEVLTIYLTDSNDSTTANVYDVDEDPDNEVTDPAAPERNWQVGLLTFTPEADTFEHQTAGIYASTNAIRGLVVTMAYSDATSKIVNDDSDAEYYASISSAKNCSNLSTCTFTVGTHGSSEADAGSWGYASSATVSDSSYTFNPIPASTSPATLYSTTTKGDTRDYVIIGLQTSSVAAAGHYSGSLVFTAVTNIVNRSVKYSGNVTNLNTQTATYIENFDSTTSYHLNGYTDWYAAHDSSDLLETTGSLDAVNYTTTAATNASNVSTTTINVYDLPSREDFSGTYEISSNWPGREDPFSYSHTATSASGTYNCSIYSGLDASEYAAIAEDGKTPVSYTGFDTSNCKLSRTDSYSYSGLAGRVFLGYTVDKASYDPATDTLYQPGDSLASLDQNKNHTLYAQWGGYAIAVLVTNPLIQVGGSGAFYAYTNSTRSTSSTLLYGTDKSLGQMLFLVNDNIYDNMFDYRTSSQWSNAEFHTSYGTLYQKYTPLTSSNQSYSIGSGVPTVQDSLYEQVGSLIGDLHNYDYGGPGWGNSGAASTGEYFSYTKTNVTTTSKMLTLQKILYVPTYLQNFNQNSRITDLPTTMSSIQTINFDETFQAFTPLSTKGWFAAGTISNNGATLTLGNVNTTPAADYVSDAETPDGSWYRYVDKDGDGEKDSLQILGTYTDAYSSFQRKRVLIRSGSIVSFYTEPASSWGSNYSWASAVNFRHVKDLSYMFYGVRLKPNTALLNDGKFYEPSSSSSRLTSTNYACTEYDITNNATYTRPDFMTNIHVSSGCTTDADSNTLYPYTYPTAAPSIAILKNTSGEYNSTYKTVIPMAVASPFVIEGTSTSSLGEHNFEYPFVLDAAENFSHMFEYYLYNDSTNFNFTWSRATLGTTYAYPGINFQAVTTDSTSSTIKDTTSMFAHTPYINYIQVATAENKTGLTPLNFLTSETSTNMFLSTGATGFRACTAAKVSDTNYLIKSTSTPFISSFQITNGDASLALFPTTEASGSLISTLTLTSSQYSTGYFTYLGSFGSASGRSNYLSGKSTYDLGVNKCWGTEFDDVADADTGDE